MYMSLWSKLKDYQKAQLFDYFKKNYELKKEVTTMSMESEILMRLILRIGDYVYGRWKQKV